MAKISLQFDTSIAKEIDTNSAIILQNIEFWQFRNKINNHNFFEGRYWVYNSVKAWSELFDFLTEKQIRTCLSKLEKHEYLITGNFNKMRSDRTKWYTSIRIAQMGNCNLPNGKMDLTEQEIAFDQIGKPLPVIKQTIENPISINSDEIENFTQSYSQTELFKKIKKSKKEKLPNDVVFPIVKKLSSFFPSDIVSKLSRNDKLNWSKTIEELIRLDEYTEEQIEKAVKTAREHHFWKKQFLSLTKLRKKDKQGIKYIQVFLQLTNEDDTGDSNYNEKPKEQPQWKN